MPGDLRDKIDGLTSEDIKQQLESFEERIKSLNNDEKYQEAIKLAKHACDLVEIGLGDDCLEYAQRINQLAIVHCKIGFDNKIRFIIYLTVQ